MEIRLEKSWSDALRDELDKRYFLDLVAFVESEYASKNGQIFPNAEHVFRALNSCRLPDVKVVILGQDPYHGPGQAHGLCFSVNDGIDFPPSLRNIFKELN